MERLTEGPIRSEELIAAVSSDADGAVALFLGIVRDHNEGRRVRFLEYHAYPAMAEAELERIEEEAKRRFPISRLRVAHRTGRLEIGDVSVGVAVASHHRKDAIDACRYLIDELKRTVPIWKREHFEGGVAWIEGEPGA